MPLYRFIRVSSYPPECYYWYETRVWNDLYLNHILVIILYLQIYCPEKTPKTGTIPPKQTWLHCRGLHVTKVFNQSTICWMWEKHHTCTCIHIGLYWYPNYRIQTWCGRISMSLGGTVIHIYRQVNNVWGHNSCYNSQIKMTWKWEFQRFHNHIPFCSLDIKNIFFLFLLHLQT